MDIEYKLPYCGHGQGENVNHKKFWQFFRTTAKQIPKKSGNYPEILGILFYLKI
jgi:hypothetical protein